jgi:hypothetical protein
MNKKCILSVVVLFVLSMLLGFLVHGFLLGASYQELPGVMRLQEDAAAVFPWMILAHLVKAVGLTWIYRAGAQAGKAWLGQGLRFGVALALLLTIPTYLIYHAVAQFPLELALMQIGYDGVAVLVLGIAAAFINR